MASRGRGREHNRGRGRRTNEVAIPVGSLTDIMTTITSVVAAIGVVAAATIRVMDGMEPQAGTGNDGDNEYEGGHNVLNTGVPVGYPEQVNTGQETGESSRRTEVARNRREPFTKKKGPITPKSQNFKKKRLVASHSQRRNNDRRNDNRSDPNLKGQTSAQPDDLRCSRCKKHHPSRLCRAGLGVCYKCGRPGHMSWNCSKRMPKCN
ncbi:uncharacterized protein LOC110266534 [Arachis ipaensis]|uniref:CCHC-type domain-containing protein n=1 Tax=Arachis hypogaea TaxID=3818 RepID=A0A6B9V4F7_ARAHY|nr:uncharacterized protein LOC110266534 [Arachis ipaensis]QHN76346.1 uncharacterized protein DS421_19g643100 [Arachis hypogaea]